MRATLLAPRPPGWVDHDVSKMSAKKLAEFMEGEWPQFRFPARMTFRKPPLVDSAGDLQSELPVVVVFQCKDGDLLDSCPNEASLLGLKFSKKSSGVIAKILTGGMAARNPRLSAGMSLECIALREEEPDEEFSIEEMDLQSRRKHQALLPVAADISANTASALAAQVTAFKQEAMSEDCRPAQPTRLVWFPHGHDFLLHKRSDPEFSAAMTAVHDLWPGRTLYCHRQHPDLAEGYFPKLSADNTSVMARVMTDTYFEQNNGSTSNDVTLADCINTGCVNEDATVGCHALDAECYDLFQGFFDQVVSSCHNGYSADHTHTILTPGEVLPTVNESAVASLGLRQLSFTAVRNVELGSGKFAPAFEEEDWLELEATVRTVLDGLEGERWHGTYRPLCEIANKELRELVTLGVFYNGAVNRFEAASFRDHGMKGRGVFTSNDGAIHVVIGGADHLRVVCTEYSKPLETLSFAGCLNHLLRFLDCMESGLRAAGKELMISANRGYLSPRPCALGSGITAAVHMGLPLQPSAIETYGMDTINAYLLEACNHEQTSTRTPWAYLMEGAEKKEGDKGTFVLEITTQFLLGCSEAKEVARFITALQEIYAAAAAVMEDTAILSRPVKALVVSGDVLSNAQNHTLNRTPKNKASFQTLDREQVTECFRLSQELAHRTAYAQQLTIEIDSAANIAPAGGWLKGMSTDTYVVAILPNGATARTGLASIDSSSGYAEWAEPLVFNVTEEMNEFVLEIRYSVKDALVARSGPIKLSWLPTLRDGECGLDMILTTEFLKQENALVGKLGKGVGKGMGKIGGLGKGKLGKAGGKLGSALGQGAGKLGMRKIKPNFGAFSPRGRKQGMAEGFVTLVISMEEGAMDLKRLGKELEANMVPKKIASSIVRQMKASGRTSEDGERTANVAAAPAVIEAYAKSCSRIPEIVATVKLPEKAVLGAEEEEEAEDDQQEEEEKKEEEPEPEEPEAELETTNFWRIVERDGVEFWQLYLPDATIAPEPPSFSSPGDGLPILQADELPPWMRPKELKLEPEPEPEPAKLMIKPQPEPELTPEQRPSKAIAAHSTDILNPTPIAEHAAKLQFLLQNVSRKVTIREAGEKKSEALMAAEAMDDDVDGTVMMRVLCQCALTTEMSEAESKALDWLLGEFGMRFGVGEKYRMIFELRMHATSFNPTLSYFERLLKCLEHVNELVLSPSESELVRVLHVHMENVFENAFASYKITFDAGACDSGAVALALQCFSHVSSFIAESHLSDMPDDTFDSRICDLLVEWPHHAMCSMSRGRYQGKDKGWTQTPDALRLALIIDAIRADVTLDDELYRFAFPEDVAFVVAIVCDAYYGILHRTLREFVANLPEESYTDGMTLEVFLKVQDLYMMFQEVAPDMDSEIEDCSILFNDILKAVLVAEQVRLEAWIARAMRHDSFASLNDAEPGENDAESCVHSASVDDAFRMLTQSVRTQLQYNVHKTRDVAEVFIACTHVYCKSLQVQAEALLDPFKAARAALKANKKKRKMDKQLLGKISLTKLKHEEHWHTTDVKAPVMPSEFWVRLNNMWVCAEKRLLDIAIDPQVLFPELEDEEEIAEIEDMFMKGCLATRKCLTDTIEYLCGYVLEDLLRIMAIECRRLARKKKSAKVDESELWDDITDYMDDLTTKAHECAYDAVFNRLLLKVFSAFSSGMVKVLTGDLKGYPTVKYETPGWAIEMFDGGLSHISEYFGAGLSEKNVQKICARMSGDVGLFTIHREATTKLVIILESTGEMDDASTQASQWDHRRTFHRNTLAVLSLRDDCIDVLKTLYLKGGHDKVFELLLPLPQHVHIEKTPALMLQKTAMMFGWVEKQIEANVAGKLTNSLTLGLASKAGLQKSAVRCWAVLWRHPQSFKTEPIWLVIYKEKGNRFEPFEWKQLHPQTYMVSPPAEKIKDRQFAFTVTTSLPKKVEAIRDLRVADSDSDSESDEDDDAAPEPEASASKSSGSASSAALDSKALKKSVVTMGGHVGATEFEELDDDEKEEMTFCVDSWADLSSWMKSLHASSYASKHDAEAEVEDYVTDLDSERQAELIAEAQKLAASSEQERDEAARKIRIRNARRKVFLAATAEIRRRETKLENNIFKIRAKAKRIGVTKQREEARVATGEFEAAQREADAAFVNMSTLLAQGHEGAAAAKVAATNLAKAAAEAKRAMDKEVGEATTAIQQECELTEEWMQMREKIEAYNHDVLSQIAVERKAIANQEAMVQQAKAEEKSVQVERLRREARELAAAALPEAHLMDLSSTPAHVLESTSIICGDLTLEIETNKVSELRRVMLWRHPKLQSGDFVMLMYKDKDGVAPLALSFLSAGDFDVMPTKTARAKYPHSMRIGIMKNVSKERKQIAKYVFLIKEDDVRKQWDGALANVNKTLMLHSDLFRCTKKQKFQEGVDAKSNTAGTLEAGDCVEVLEEVVDEETNITRTRFNLGWCTKCAPGPKPGQTILYLKTAAAATKGLIRNNGSEKGAHAKVNEMLETMPVKILRPTAAVCTWTRAMTAKSKDFSLCYMVAWRHPDADPLQEAYSVLLYASPESQKPLSSSLFVIPPGDTFAAFEDKSELSKGMMKTYKHRMKLTGRGKGLRNFTFSLAMPSKSARDELLHDLQGLHINTRAMMGPSS